MIERLAQLRVVMLHGAGQVLEYFVYYNYIYNILLIVRIIYENRDTVSWLSYVMEYCIGVYILHRKKQHTFSTLILNRSIICRWIDWAEICMKTKMLLNVNIHNS